jgi:hypothetical protein
MQVTDARENTCSILDRCAHPSGKLSFSYSLTLAATGDESLMFSHFDLAFFDVKDLAAHTACRALSLKRALATPTDGRQMSNDFIWVGYLPERSARMMVLAANSQPGLLSEASGALYLLPRQIKGWR